MRLVTHPLDDPRPVLADVSLRAGCEGSYAGWSGERVVWASRTLPYVATFSEVRRALLLHAGTCRPAGHYRRHKHAGEGRGEGSCEGWGEENCRPTALDNGHGGANTGKAPAIPPLHLCSVAPTGG